MKVAILAGGGGTRLAEETDLRPKPMIEIGGRPILWHIMMHFASHGFKDFVVALGHKGEYIKRYMLDYSTLGTGLSVHLEDGRVERDQMPHHDWTVDLIDTGIDTMTGGRIRRLQPYLGDSTFVLTWADGVSDIDLHDLLRYHRSHGRLATVTAVRPPARFGKLQIDGDQVVEFAEKPQIEEGWISGAFFVLEPGVFDYIGGDDAQWEREPLERLAAAGELMAYKHYSFWQCMDTLRDRRLLESLWQSGNPPWKSWD
ncbi:MAG TPA: glucose-1-phosphate cytidylyltransferase [Dehalococcoidia bacterium]|nr:glucose-1-phosphate cytidylyltransferase [Dehalococcoidia bacterium]